MRKIATGIHDPWPVSMTVLPLTSVSDEEYTTLLECFQCAIPYLEKTSGLRYYPTRTWIVNTTQMEKLPPQEKLPEGLGNIEAASKFWALYYIVYSLSLNFHIHSDQRFDDYEPYTHHSEAIQKIRFAAECIAVIDKIAKGDDLGEWGDYFRIANFSDSPDHIVNIEKCLREMVVVWRAISKRLSNDSVHLYHQYWPRHEEKLLDGIPHAELLPQHIRTLLNICLHNGVWHCPLDTLCDLFDSSITELIPLLYRLSRTSKESYSSIYTIIRAAGLYLPEHSTTVKTLLTITRESDYPSFFVPGSGGNVIIDIESLRYSSLNKVDFFKNLTSLIIHEHAHALFAEGVNVNGHTGHIKPTFEASVANESLAEWMELNYWRNDPDMSRKIFEHAYRGDFPEWKYAGMVLVESHFMKKGIRGMHSLMISLRKGSQNIWDLLYKY